LTLRPDAGLVQSLLIKAQRTQLDAIGRQVGTPVVYLKAAWADPALYGGRGERVGGDVDILVLPDRFEAFAQVLADRGFRRCLHGSPSYERYFGHKEWSFDPPRGSLAVDLHRALTEPIWYDLPAEEVMARAIFWDTVDGPLLSLDAEDQLLYAAAHYANHFYDLDDRHLKDCRRLLAAHPVDWDAVWARATRAHLRLPLALMVEALQKQGTAIGPPPPAALGIRRRLAGLVVSTSAGLGRRRPRNRALDYLFLHPLLSGRPTALPRIIATYGVPWLAERWRAARS
jgi:hypothetical protein